MEIRELAFRSSLQLKIRKPESELKELLDSSRIIDNADIWGYGSGFLIQYKNRYFFVTAAHNVHPDDHDPDNITDQRTCRDYQITIITNNKGPDLSSIM